MKAKARALRAGCMNISLISRVQAAIGVIYGVVNH